MSRKSDVWGKSACAEKEMASTEQRRQLQDRAHSSVNHIAYKSCGATCQIYFSKVCVDTGSTSQKSISRLGSLDYKACMLLLMPTAYA